MNAQQIVDQLALVIENCSGNPAAYRTHLQSALVELQKIDTDLSINIDYMDVPHLISKKDFEKKMALRNAELDASAVEREERAQQLFERFMLNSEHDVTVKVEGNLLTVCQSGLKHSGASRMDSYEYSVEQRYDIRDMSNLAQTEGAELLSQKTARTVRTLNLTQHTATAEQGDAGVVEPANKLSVQSALTFDAIPTPAELQQRAEILAAIAVDSGCKTAMIGGAPFFMSALERALIDSGVIPVYAFSRRESVEKTADDGSVIKTNVFKHVGFVKI